MVKLVFYALFSFTIIICRIPWRFALIKIKSNLKYRSAENCSSLLVDWGLEQTLFFHISSTELLLQVDPTKTIWRSDPKKLVRRCRHWPGRGLQAAASAGRREPHGRTAVLPTAALGVPDE
jgi:hypothetical protein